MSGPPLLVSEQSELSVLSGCLLSAVCSLALRDPQGPGAFYPRARFRTIFAPFFGTHFFTTICTKRTPTGTPKTGQKLKKLLKTWLPNASMVETCKKAPLGKGQTLKRENSYTL